METSSIIASCIVVLVTYVAYSLVNFLWLRPLKLQKFLTKQGFKGNPYKFLLGDSKETSMMVQQALSKPIEFEDDISPRVMPHIYNCVKKHGKRSYLWVGRMPKVQIVEPELVREALNKYNNFQKNFSALDPLTKFVFNGLGSYEGDKWQKHRKVINPTFKMDKLKLMLDAFYTASLEMINRWEQKVLPKGIAEFDVWNDIEMLSESVLSLTIFGNSHGENKRIFELMAELIVLTIQAASSVYLPGMRFLPTKRNTRMKKINKELVAEIMVIINSKKKAMKAGDTKSGDIFMSSLLGSGMSIQDVISECKLFYFGGKDTTSTMLMWTMVLLSKHQEWQARAREEVLEIFGNRKPDWDGVNHMKTITMILYEVLRLFPPVVELSRYVHEDTQLGDVTIPAGVQVQMPIMVVQRDPELWGKDVLEFKPERFEGGMLNAAKVQGAYIPFGLGPRMCIGQNFALLEVKMALAMMLPRFKFELSPSYVHAPFTVLNLLPQHGAKLILKKI